MSKAPHERCFFIVLTQLRGSSKIDGLVESMPTGLRGEVDLTSMNKTLIIANFILNWD